MIDFDKTEREKTEHKQNISALVWFGGALVIICMFLFIEYYSDHPEKKLPFSNQARQCKTLFVHVIQAFQPISPTNDPPGRARPPAEPSSSLCSSGALSPESSPGRANPPGEPSPSPCNSDGLSRRNLLKADQPPENPTPPSYHCPQIDRAATDRAVLAAISPTYSELGNYLQISDIQWQMDQQQIDRGIDVNAEAIETLRRRIATIETSALTLALIVHGDHACHPLAAEPINIVHGIRHNDIDKLMEYNKHRLWLIEQAKYPWRNYDPKLKAQVASMSTEDRFALINQESETLTHLHRLMWGRDVDIIYMTAPVWPYRPTTRLIYDTRNHMPQKKD